MPRKKGSTLPRGIIHWPGQPGIYGIRYVDAGGKDTKEKAGSLSTAKALYARRVADALEGKKCPKKRNRLTVSQAIHRGHQQLHGEPPLRLPQAMHPQGRAGPQGRTGSDYGRQQAQ